MVNKKEYARLEEIIRYKMHPHIWTLKELQRQYNHGLKPRNHKNPKEIGNMLKCIKSMMKFKYASITDGVNYIFVERIKNDDK